MTDDNGDNDIKQWEQFTRDVLHLAGHTDEQIDAMRAKAIEDAKPKPPVIIPWKPIPPEAWDKHYADEALKKATAATKTLKADLARKGAALTTAEEDAERYKKQAQSSEHRYEAMMKAQRTGGKA
jgi:hypothetical protein